MTTTATEKLIRTYSDRQYCHTTMVNHKGTVIAFAMDENRHIYYAVLDISQQDKGFLDVNYWPEDPQLLLFPSEVEQVGYSIAGTTAMPIVKKGSIIEATSEEIQPEEMDLFLSSTARLTANAPFQVISDNKHIFVFRQSIGSEDGDMVFKLANGQASGDNSRPESDYILNKGQKIPIVENTLLCDRFILSGKELRQKIEIRYRRSRHRTQAAGANDSMGPKDMEGNFFFEPTQELAFVKNMQYGNFSVLQLPTQVSDVKRWQIFSHNSATERIDSFNLEVSGDGLFNPAGTQLYTSPDPEYQPSVLEREPGSCPFTNAPLIPMVNKANLAESALKFDGSKQQRLNFGVDVGNGSVTVEAWIKAENVSGYQNIVGRFNHASKTTNQKGFLFGIADGKVRMAVHNNSLKLHHQADTENTITAGEWVHIAGTWEELTGVMTLYINGIKQKEDNSSIQGPIIYDSASEFCINGSTDTDGYFTGIIDEVRLWKRVLDEEEISSSKNLRLTGDEPALEGYWRLDEGGGITAYDQTNNAHHGTLVNSPQWVASDAPLGDHPGIQKSSFLLGGEGTEKTATKTESVQTKTITVTETTQESFTPKCLYLDGSNDYISIAVGSGLELGKAATFEFWAKGGSRGGYSSILDSKNPANAREVNIHFPWGNGGSVYWDAGAAGTSGYDRINKGIDSRYNREWCHWSFIKDSTKGVMSIYLNGELWLNGTGKNRSFGKILELVIGRAKWAGPDYWNGSIAEVRLWKVARSQQDIQDNMNRRLKGDEEGLVVYYTFEEGSGNRVADQSNQGYQGTLHGSPRWQEAGITLEREIEVTREEEVEVPLTPEELAEMQKIATLNCRGLAAKLYFQQEDAILGYHQQPRPMKKNARVMLAITNNSRKVATLDFGVSREGKIARLPDSVVLPSIKEPEGSDSGDTSELEAEILKLQQDIQQLNYDINASNQQISSIPQLEREKATLETEIQNLKKQVLKLSNYEVQLSVPGKGLIYSSYGNWWKFLDKGSGYYAIKSFDPSSSSSPSYGLFGFSSSSPEYCIGDPGGYSSVSYSGSGDDAHFHWRTSVTMSGDSEQVVLTNRQTDRKLCYYKYSGFKFSNDHPENAKLTIKWGKLINQNVASQDSLLKEKQQGLADKIEAIQAAFDQENVLKEQELQLENLQYLLKNKEAELEMGSGGVIADIDLPSQLIYTDTSGLTINGGLLGFTDTDEAPTLFESASGKLMLYYKDLEGQLMAAYYDTKVSKSRYSLASSGLTFVARTAGENTNNATITISDGDKEETCNLLIKNDTLGITETWHNLPRNPEKFALIVNAKEPIPDEVTASITPIYYSLETGSPQFGVVADKTVSQIENGDAIKIREGISNVWTSDAPGKAYYFDGKTNLLTLPVTDVSTLDIESNFTLEAWVNSAGGTYDHCRLIQLHSEASAYLLGLEQENGQFYILAGVSQGKNDNYEGKQIVRSEVPLAQNIWNHVAYTFSQSYALAFDGNSYLEIPRNPALDITENLTLEVFLKVENLGKVQGILTHGYLGDDEHRVPYQLSIDESGKICLAFEDHQRNVYTYRSRSTITVGQFHSLAVTTKKGVTETSKKGTQTFEFTDAEGNTQTQELELVESVETKEWLEITFYLDGQQIGISRHEKGLPTSGETAVEIGRIGTAKGKIDYLNGVIGEIRIWNKVRTAEEIGAKLKGYEQGLTAWWQFEENQGNIAFDQKGENHAKLKGTQWVKNPDPQGSLIRVYVNGIAIPTNKLNPDHAFMQAGWGDLTFSLGGYQNDGNAADLFRGTLEEIRIWRVQRTQEQLMDNLFSRLKGERQDLIAYYTFDDVSTEVDATQLYDQGLRGNHITLPEGDALPRTILSTAPVGDDASMVRSALAGVGTSFHQKADEALYVQEYGDLQKDSRGNTTGVMKRCYAYLQDGVWKLFTGYKVGNLITEWIGQANFNPQIIGYVEGDPPVPSENLTDGAISVDIHNYSFIGQLSNIELSESEVVSYNISSSTEGSIDGAFDAAIKMGGGNKTMLITAPMGFGIGTEATDLDFEVGLKGHFEGSAGWSNEESFGTSINKTQTIAIELGGAWESPSADKQLNPTLGRRLLAGNVGFAIVQSETADIFALRLAHNHALVSFSIRPNPDIPKDKNIIPFPINPRYIKQGTLDGRVGYDDQGSIVLDPDYANASGYGEYSYFKPKEAYALKRKIEKQEQALKSFYDNAGTDYSSLSSQIVGSAAKAAGSLLAGASPLAAQSIQEVSDKTQTFSSNKGLPEKFAKRDIANTYIWTADGGFYAESTETADVRTESTSGSFSFSGSVGGTFNTEIEIFSFGIGVEFEAALGGGYSTSRTRDKESEKTFGMEMGHDVPGDLQVYYRDEDGDLKRRYDADGNPVNAVGKVDAYRWMSFYLDSAKENFEDLYYKVIDPVWLAESDHPNAIAIRQAQQNEKKPACWRVLHRVTFVSRLLPEMTDDTVASPLEQAMRAENVESNWQLIKKIEPFVKNKTGDAVAFSNAVRQALQDYLPELVPHATEVIQYLQLYYGMED